MYGNKINGNSYHPIDDKDIEQVKNRELIDDATELLITNLIPNISHTLDDQFVGFDTHDVTKLLKKLTSTNLKYPLSTFLHKQGVK